MANSFYRIQILDFDFDFEDQLTELSFRYGCSGISEDLAFVQTDLTYEPKISQGASKNLNIYFESEPTAGFLTELQTRFPSTRFQIVREQNQDWLAEWKKNFEPFTFVGDFWIVPSWLKSPVAPDKTFLIDPGMAFGTGTHATTQLCALQIQKLLKKHSLPAVLDVGTGTGVLAMLAARLGSKYIVGVDNDPEAIRTAKQNQDLNQNYFPTSIAYSEQPLDEFTKPFDLVVANIIDGVLLRLFPQLLRNVSGGGFLILSGILVEREEQFLTDILRVSKKLERKMDNVLRLEKDEWTSVCFCIRNTTD